MTSFSRLGRSCRRNRRAPEPQPGPLRRCLSVTFVAFESGAWIASSWQAPGAHGLSQLLERQHVTGERLPVCKLRRPITALGIEKIEQAGSSPLVGVLADIPGIL